MSRYEEPAYETVARRHGYTIRRYQPYLVAETVVAGTFDGTGSTAFRRLAGFIFGRNDAAKKMKMTIPVTRQRAAEGSFRYRFVMEAGYTTEDLPHPIDETVEVREVAAGYVAAARYRGSTAERLYRRNERALLEALRRDGIAVVGSPIAAVYNGPMTPPWLRRNEVLVPVAWTPAEVAPTGVAAGSAGEQT